MHYAIKIYILILPLKYNNFGQLTFSLLSSYFIEIFVVMHEIIFWEQMY